MPQFAYEALDSQGKEVKDVIEALTEDEARSRIRQMDYFPTDVKEVVAKKSAGAVDGKKGKTRKKKDNC